MSELHIFATRMGALSFLYICIINETKTSFLSRKRAITTFLSRKSMITRLSIAFEDFLGSSIAPQVMPPCRLTMISLKCLYCGWTIRFWEEIETKSQYSDIGWWDISVLDSFSKERFNQSIWDTFGKLLEVHGRPCNWRSLQEGFNSYEN